MTHYSIRDQLRTLEDLLGYFPVPVADEMNFCLFSTSGVHGSYTTIEQIESDPESYGGEVTVLVCQPRRVMLAYGNVPVTAESAPYLKALRASSWDVVSRIGRDEGVEGAAVATDYEKRWLQAERDAGDAERALATAVGLLRRVQARGPTRGDGALTGDIRTFLATQGDR